MSPAPKTIERFILPQLETALFDSPAVLVHGPRQCGKTTVARAIAHKHGYEYLTFDDDDIRATAEADPIGFVERRASQTVLDEVQRVPGLLTSVKASIDRDRTPGRFLLTGSSNVLLLPALSDSLAGRLALQRLHPFSQDEILGVRSDFLARLFEGEFLGGQVNRLGAELAERVVDGGYPAALARPLPRRRAAWYRDYIETIVQKDIREMARIGSLDAIPKLVAMAAGQTARLVNVTDLASPFQITRQTIREYLTLLQRLFLIDELPPWHGNHLSRLVKTPKLHIGDTGLAAAVLGIDAVTLWSERTLLGQLTETFVYQELRRQASWAEDDLRFHHYRDRDGMEVDIVLERGYGQLAGIEVKAAATVSAGDFRGLRKLKSVSGDRFRVGVVLYDGTMAGSFGDGMFAVPIRQLFGEAEIGDDLPRRQTMEDAADAKEADEAKAEGGSMSLEKFRRRLAGG